MLYHSHYFIFLIVKISKLQMLYYTIEILKLNKICYIYKLVSSSSPLRILLLSRYYE